MMEPMVAGTAGRVSLVVGGPVAAAAHPDAVVTPGGNLATLPCEPFHGTTPGEGQHPVIWDSARELHAIHRGLQTSPSEDEGSIDIVVVGLCS